MKDQAIKTPKEETQKKKKNSKTKQNTNQPTTKA